MGERLTANAKVWDDDKQEYVGVEFEITEEQYRIFSAGIGNAYSLAGAITAELEWAHFCGDNPLPVHRWSRFCPDCGVERPQTPGNSED